MKPNATLEFLKSRLIPFKLLTLLEKELDKLVQIGILTKVKKSEWATPIVPILKANGTIRVCGDPLHYPQLIQDELFVKLTGGVKFSKIDLRQACLQLEIHPKDSKLLTLNTHRGFYTVNRLMYDIPGMAIFLDNIVITARSDCEYLRRLHTVLERLHKHNVRINIKKSKFFTQEVQYCGYVLRKDGIHKESSKMEAIKKMPRPQNITDVRVFVKMINYYSRFIRNLSCILKPLNILLHKNTHFAWTRKQKEAFKKAKAAFASNQVLAHFETEITIVLNGRKFIRSRGSFHMHIPMVQKG
ncbi:hypothetical protein ACFW04_014039 [Cataglyphis niger]